MKIGLDFDGVISDCGKLKILAAKKLYGLDIPSSQFKFELIVGKKILTEDQYRNLQSFIYHTWEYGKQMEPIDGALKYIPLLIKNGHEITIITSRNGTALGVAKRWAKEQQIELDFIGVGPGISKAGAARGLDLYVDDDLDKLEQLVGIVPMLYLFSQTYNADVQTDNISGRVTSWCELNKIIEQ